MPEDFEELGMARNTGDSGPRYGVAPGMSSFLIGRGPMLDEVENAVIYVGGSPKQVPPFNYQITWSAAMS